MHLFAPLQIRDVALRNRVVMSPMCQYSSVDGFAGDWHLVHLGSRAVGGAALILAEASAVEAGGRISPHDLGIYRDEHVEPLRRITRFVHEQGAVAGIQLAHAGRKASTARPWEGGRPLGEDEGGWRPVVAPSAIPFGDGYPTPEALDAAADRGRRPRFRGRRPPRTGGRVPRGRYTPPGYLLHEFLSPLSNRRADRYGGDFAGRTRLLRDVARGRSGRCGRSAFPVRAPVGHGLDGRRLGRGAVRPGSRAAQAARVDLVDCSSGGAAPGAAIPVGPGYQVPFAERIRREADVLTGAVGMITRAPQADEIVPRRPGRTWCSWAARRCDPYWPLRAARELDQDAPVPAQWPRGRGLDDPRPGWSAGRGAPGRLADPIQECFLLGPFPQRRHRARAGGAVAYHPAEAPKARFLRFAIGVQGSARSRTATCVGVPRPSGSSSPIPEKVAA